MEHRIWVPIIGKIKNFEVCSDGCVRCSDNRKAVPEYFTGSGESKRLTVRLDNKHFYKVHRLVAEAFIPNPHSEINTVVHHIDGNPFNNNASNLMWCTYQYNNSEPIAKKRNHDS